MSLCETYDLMEAIGADGTTGGKIGRPSRYMAENRVTNRASGGVQRGPVTTMGEGAAFGFYNPV